MADLSVGIERDVARGVVDEPDRQRRFERAAASLVDDAPAQTRAQHVQLGVRHRALQPEQEPIVEVARVVDAVFVEDERVGQRADLEEPVPVGGVAREARDLEAEHNARAPHADFADELLEAFAIGGRRAGLAEVGVDDVDALDRPAERDGALPQCVLTPRALRVLEDLPHRRLAHVEVCVAAQVTGGDLLVDGLRHACISWRWLRAIDAKTRTTSALTSSSNGGLLRGADGVGVEGGGSVDHAPIHEAMPWRSSTTRPSRGVEA